jgi:hypothetical protein
VLFKLAFELVPRASKAQFTHNSPNIAQPQCFDRRVLT